MSQVAGQRRSHSPDAAGGSERKRRRKVLSCYDCRRRKLQCDRGMPACSRCTKAGQPANCLYLEDSGETPTRNIGYPSNTDGHSVEMYPGQPARSAAPSADLLSRLEYQERRIKELETALAQKTPSQPVDQRPRHLVLPYTPESIVTHGNDTDKAYATDRDTMLLRGKSFKTQFHGTTYPGSLIAYIPELNTFTKETFEKFPALFRIRHELKALEDRTDYAGSRPQSTTDAELIALLPPKAETDELIQLYLDNYDNIYHVIHLPTFRKEYEESWRDIGSARPHFAAIVLLIVSTVQCLRNDEPILYTANSSVPREKALTLIRVCEDWLQSQSQKHVAIADFQIRFLLVLAKLINASKFKRMWTEAGNLLRFCMAAGLHRSPELLRKPTSMLDKEMRRRIWAAVADFELQASFWRGMVSTNWPQQSDCSAPITLQDEVFHEDHNGLLHPRPASEFTSVSYLVLAGDSFMLRHDLNTALNSIRHQITSEETKRYTEEVEVQIRAIPLWNERAAQVPRALLELTLRNYLLVLHDRQLRSGTSTSERNFSKMVLVDTAKKIIDTQKALVDQGLRALQFLCHDQLRAALSVVYAATTADPQADSIIGQVIESNATHILNDAVDLIMDKVIPLGREQRQLWVTLAANGFMKAKKNPSRKSEYMQEAVDKITRPYYKIMACQGDAPTTAASSGRPAGGRDDMPNGLIEYLPVVEQQKAAEFGLSNDPALLDFDAMSAWTFDDWSFNPMDFPTFAEPYPLQP